MSEAWIRARLGDALTLALDKVPVEPGREYDLAGVYSFGRGLFRRDPLRAEMTSYKQLNVLHTDRFVMSKLKAWEGAVTVVASDFQGAVLSQEFPTYEIDPSVLLPGYLRLLTTHQPFWALLATQSTGMGGRKERVHQTRVLEVELNLPPIDQQRRIIDLFAAVDSAHREAQLLHDCLAGLALSVTVDWFDHREATVVPLGDLCDPGGIQIGPFGSQLHASDYVEHGTPTVMPKDIVGNEISEATIARVPDHKVAQLRRHCLEPGDILLPRRGDLTKRAMVREQHRGWLCGTGTVRVRVAGPDPAVAYQALTTPAVNRWLADNAVGATMPNLNSSLVAAIPVRIPPGSEVVVAALDDMHRGLAAAAAVVAGFVELRLALLSDLVEGVHRIPDSYDDLLASAS